MTINQRGLTDKQRAVVATIRMRLTLPQSLDYMKGEGFPVSQASYYRIRSWIKKYTITKTPLYSRFWFRATTLGKN